MFKIVHLPSSFWNKKQNAKSTETVSATKRARARHSQASRGMSIDSGAEAAASDEDDQTSRKKKRASTALSKAAGNGKRKSLSALDACLSLRSKLLRCFKVIETAPSIFGK